MSDEFQDEGNLATRKADFTATRRLLSDPRDAFNVHLALTVSSNRFIGHEAILGGLADYLVQYVQSIVQEPADAQAIVDRIAEFMVDRAAGRLGMTDAPKLDIVN